MYEIKVTSEFSSAHRLRNYSGRCEKLHGHNWTVEVCVCSGKLNKIGIAVDFKEVKNKLKCVTEKLDHSYLNNLAYFKKANPTSENIARFIYEGLKKEGLRPASVSVWEGKGSCATYYG